jgi:hypothetical protein
MGFASTKPKLFIADDFLSLWNHRELKNPAYNKPFFTDFCLLVMSFN